MFLKGIVEGFYGRQWSWQARRDYAERLSAWGLNCYLYCPKGDPWLRRQWWQHWPEQDWRELRALAQCYNSQQLQFGVGLSPYALYQNYGSAERGQLRDKVMRLNELEAGVLALLFDDMPGDCPDLAQRQADIVADVRQWSAADALLMCPTYYSYDPQLESYFGAMPAHYWRDLGALLEPDVAILWTGNEVCSATISSSDITAISAALGRAPMLWDNYPVNDGARASQFLHLQPLPGREPGLESVVAGHLCNPMNQAGLSAYPLAGLAHLYGAGEARLEDYYSAELSARLRADQALFESTGLSGMSAEDKRRLQDLYGDLDDPAAAEVVDWLAGGYAFDPACLTD